MPNAVLAQRRAPRAHRRRTSTPARPPRAPRRRARARHVARERLLRRALLRRRRRLRVERLDLLARQQREVAEVASDVRVVGREPELIERVRRRARRVEPDGARFRLAELRARRRRDERHRQRVRLGAIHAADQLDPRRDVAPLIAPAELQRHAVAPAELEEVVRLEQHVRELGVRDARVHARAHRVLLQHVVHGEVLADVAQEVHQVQRVQPLRVVAHARRARSLEVEEALELRCGSPSAFAATCSAVSSWRSVVLPLGSPIIPVPPPTSAIGR